MEKSIRVLIDELNEIWNLSKDERFKGEHPRCIEIQEKLIAILNKKTDDEIMDILNSFDDSKSDQMEYIVEELVSNHNCVSVFLKD
ncbi:MAG: hypothetical protein ACI4XI_04165 [Ruminococcus sp.]